MTIGSRVVVVKKTKEPQLMGKIGYLEKMGKLDKNSDKFVWKIRLKHPIVVHGNTLKYVYLGEEYLLETLDDSKPRDRSELLY